MAPPHGGGDSDGCVLSGVTGSRPDAMALAAALHHHAGPKVEIQQHACGLNTSTRRGRRGLRAGPAPYAKKTTPLPKMLAGLAAEE